MKKILILTLLILTFVSCSSSSLNAQSKNDNFEEILDNAEADATTGGRRILETSRAMIADLDVIVGGCWHYMNGVYNKAGYATPQRESVFKSKFNGPYLESDIIRPGDWLYFVNHSYSEIEHSAIFVAWLDKDKKEALMVNYVGGNKKKPGTYKRFIIDEVYNVIRATN